MGCATGDFRLEICLKSWCFYFRIVMDSSQHPGAESSFQDPDDQWASQAVLEARYAGFEHKTLRKENEAIASLRRENFRLRLLCYNYEQSYQKIRGDPQNLASRLFELETENAQVREEFRVRADLLNSASKVISSLKSENERLLSDNASLSSKMENIEKEWRLKYDSIVDELEECKAARRQAENKLAIYENEVVQRENCHKAELMELMQKLQNAEVKICMLEAESREASKSAFIRVADLDLTDATPLNLASKDFKPEKESEAVLLRSEAGWGGDNVVAEKENSAEPQISRPPSSLRTPSPLTTSGRHTLSVDEALRPESPNMDEVTRLKRRLVAARHLVEDLNNRNGCLSKELLSVQSLYKMDVQTLREKIIVLTDNLESERNSHLLRSGELNRQIQSLHGRIGELLKDRESIMSENANLSAKVNSLKELTQRLRRQHATELDQMNQLVQDRDGTIYELSAFLNSNPVYLADEAPASVQPDDVQSEPLEVHKKSDEVPHPATRRLHTTDISQSVIVDIEPPLPSSQTAPPNETLPLGEVTQYCHSETSSVFNDESRREQQTTFVDVAEPRELDTQAEVTRLQRELTRVKSNLIAQVKTNTRLKAAYNALALSLPSAERSIGQPAALSLSQADKSISPFLHTSKLTPKERSQVALSHSYTFGDGVAYENQPDPLEETSAHLHAALDQLKLNLSQPDDDAPATAATTPGVANGQPVTEFAHRSRVLSPIAESEALDGADPSMGPTNERTAAVPGDLTQPGSLRKLRDLYSVIRNLLLHLDDVRAVQRSFVETINRSCAVNASLNETGLGAALVQHYSFTCDPSQKPNADEKEAEKEQVLAVASEVGVDDVSKRSSSTRTPIFAVESEHADLADDTEQVCSVAQERDDTEVSHRHNVSFFNGTIAELRHNCPASPEVSVSLGAEEEEEGRDAQPSATASSSVLNKTFPLTQPQLPQQHHQLLATLRQGATLANSMTNVSYSFEHSAFGNVTFVELTNRKVFDRLSQAMVKLRNAIEECSVVVADDLLHLAPNTAAPTTSLFGVSPAFPGALDDQRPISLASDSTITQTVGKSLQTNTEAIFNYDDVSDVSSATLDSPRSQAGQAGDVQPSSLRSEAESGKESQAVSLDPQLSEMAHSLLTRFVHVMARVQTVATSMGASVKSAGDVNNSGAAQPVSKGDISSDSTASPGRPDSPRQLTAAFEAWSERARDWFSAFNAALRDPTFLPFIEGKLNALEEDFLQTFAELERARLAREAKMREELASKMASSIPLTEHEALQSKCSQLQTDCSRLLTQLDSSVPKAELELLQDEHRRLESEYTNLSQELENMREELGSKIASSVPLTEHEALQSKCSKLQAECNRLLTQLESTVPSTEHEILQDEYRHLESEYRNLSQELENVREELASKIAASVPLTEHEALQSKCSQLQADCNHLLTQLESTVPKADLEMLQDEHHRLESEYTNLSQELENVKEELASKIASSVPLTEHKALQSKCSKLQEDCNHLVSQVESTVPRTEYQALQDENRRLESEYTNLSQELEKVYRKEFDEIVERYAAILDIANSKQASVEAQCEALAEREQQLIQELADKDAIIADLEAHMTEIQAAADAAEAAAQEAAAARPEEEDALGEGTLSAEADRRVRQYPELRAIAIDLKEKLVRRTRRLETTLHEVRRLRAIIKEDETRAKNILSQTERLREQVLQKNHIIRQLEALVPHVLTSTHTTVKCSVGVQVGRGRHSKSKNAATDSSPPEDIPTVELPRASSAVCASPFTLPPLAPVAVTGTASPGLFIAEAGEGPTSAASNSSPLLALHSDLAPRMSLAINRSSPQNGCCTCFCLSSPPASATLGVTVMPTQHQYSPRAVTSSASSRQSSTRFPTPPPLAPTCTESAVSGQSNLVEVSSLMSDLLSVSQDFSNRLMAMQQTVAQLQSPLRTDAVSLPDSLSYETSSTSSSISCPLPEKSRTVDMQVVAVLKEDIARCASQLSHLCSNLVARLMPVDLNSSPSVNPTHGEIRLSGCTSEAHQKARGLIRRVVRHLSASCSLEPNEPYIADVLADLRVVLSLLKVRPTSAPERLDVNTCHQQQSLPQSSSDPQRPRRRRSNLCCEEMVGNLKDINAMLSETDNRLAASCSSLREFVSLAGDRHGQRRSAEPY
uniref:Uncharacterized protein n=1 Tax=Schistocephalus solidus TaxID=70667 RepID=A0A0X3P8I5_SCHSO